jgi:hypothetical protein
VPKDQPVKLSEQVGKMDSPDGLDLNPAPKKAVRISRRAGLAILCVVVCLMLTYAYGGYQRTQKANAAARDAGLPRNVGPATLAGSEFINSIPFGSALPNRKNVPELQPPGGAAPESMASPCGSNLQTGQPTDSIRRLDSRATDFPKSASWSGEHRPSQSLRHLPPFLRLRRTNQLLKSAAWQQHTPAIWKRA